MSETRDSELVNARANADIALKGWYMAGKSGPVPIDADSLAVLIRRTAPAAPPRGAAEGHEDEVNGTVKRLISSLRGESVRVAATLAVALGYDPRADDCPMATELADEAADKIRDLQDKLAAAEARPRAGEATRRVLGVLSRDCERASDVQTYYFGDGSEDESFTSSDILAALRECGIEVPR